MSRNKIKRIVWAIAVIVALSFVAAMVLRRHDEPKVIGNLSKEDVSEISKLAVNTERYSIKAAMKIDLERRGFGDLARHITYYPFIKVLSIEAIDSEDAVVILGTATNKAETEYVLEREGDRWKVTSITIMPYPHL